MSLGVLQDISLVPVIRIVIREHLYRIIYEGLVITTIHLVHFSYIPERNTQLLID